MRRSKSSSIVGTLVFMITLNSDLRNSDRKLQRRRGVKRLGRGGQVLQEVAIFRQTAAEFPTNETWVLKFSILPINSLKMGISSTKFCIFKINVLTKNV